MKYISTRDNYLAVDSAEAIFLGMVPGGGLFVPQDFPKYLPEGFKDLTYRELAQDIFKLYLTDYSEAEIADMVDAAYYQNQYFKPIAPVMEVGEDNILELWHGPTAAFKDMALQIMPRFLSAAIKKLDAAGEVVILVATSGDTGKAALEGFKDVPGIKIIVFYPYGGVSNIQELQMLTTEGDNTYVVGVDGNFDDCQTAVKRIFDSEVIVNKLAEKEKRFSSANSINWGRLLPQIVYYYHGYAQLLKNGKIKVGENINIVVPTGNFGNILAAYYAKRMGLPVKKLICASNINNVLTDTIKSGTYDKKRPFHRTTSPSMDILVSSNFERFIFEMLDRDGQSCNELFDSLNKTGSFSAERARENWQEFLYGDYATEGEVGANISATFDKDGYLLDPHTAVAKVVAEKYRKLNCDQTTTLIASTASPYKFPEAVLKALGVDTGSLSEREMLEKLSQISSTEIHPSLINIEQKKIRHCKRADKDRIDKVILEILKV